MQGNRPQFSNCPPQQHNHTFYTHTPHQRQHSTNSMNSRGPQNNQHYQMRSPQIFGNKPLTIKPVSIPVSSFNDIHSATYNPQKHNTRISNQGMKNSSTFNGYAQYNKRFEAQKKPENRINYKEKSRKYSQVVGLNNYQFPFGNQKFSQSAGSQNKFFQPNWHEQKKNNNGNKDQQYKNHCKTQVFQSMILSPHQETKVSVNSFNQPNNRNFNPNMQQKNQRSSFGNKNTPTNQQSNMNNRKINQSAIFDQTSNLKHSFIINNGNHQKPRQDITSRFKNQDQGERISGSQNQQKMTILRKPMSLNFNPTNKNGQFNENINSSIIQNNYQGFKNEDSLNSPQYKLASNQNGNNTPNHTNIEFKKKGANYKTLFAQEVKKTDSRVSYQSIQAPKSDNQKNQARKVCYQDFQIIEKLGKGAFGDVFLAQSKLTKFLCVLKVLSKARIKQQKLEEHVMRQIKIQCYLNHKNLVSMYGFFDDEQKIYLIMEYLQDGPLSGCRKKITQPETAFLVRQVCQGISYMHCEKIIHRDIKPQNLLMFEDHLKIADFGCTVFTDSLRRTLVGCIAYISPEQLSNNAYDEKIDVWSIGVLTYQLLMGKSPFEEDLMKITKQQHQNRLTNDSDSPNYSENRFPTLKFPDNSELSKDAKDFISCLLQQNPDDRMQVKQAMKHPFLKKSEQWQKKLERKFNPI